MRKSIENLVNIMHGGIAAITVKSDDFRFSELSMLAQHAASTETTLHLIVGSGLTAGEVQMLASLAHGHLAVDLTL